MGVREYKDWKTGFVKSINPFQVAIDDVSNEGLPYEGGVRRKVRAVRKFTEADRIKEEAETGGERSRGAPPKLGAERGGEKSREKRAGRPQGRLPNRGGCPHAQCRRRVLA